MFWQLVLAVERRSESVLHWSWWRRWHGRWARWYHSRRRAAALAAHGHLEGSECPAAQRGPATVEQAEAEAAEVDVLACVWERLEQELASKRRGGPAIVYARRRILEGIVYVMQTDCGWKELPLTYPPWKTVHSVFVAWRKAGIWNRIWAGFKPPRLAQ